MKRSNHRTRRKVQVPVASMGDIAFLLIIFFLLLSEFAKDKDLPIALPKSTKVDKIETPAAARVAIDSTGTIFLDGHRVSSAEDVEWGVRALLTKTVTDDQRHVQFKCDAGVLKETYEPVIKAIAEAGGMLEAVGEKLE